MKKMLLIIMIITVAFSVVIATGVNVTDNSAYAYNGHYLTEMTESDKSFITKYDISLDTIAPVIVETKASPLSTHTELIDKYGGIGEYLASEEGQLASAQLEQERNNAINEVRALLKSENVEIYAQYSVVLNGFALKTTVGNMFRLRELKSVSTAYTANTIVELDYEEGAVVSSLGMDPYMLSSGSMIGADSAYADGYTGKGTLTAILDTGFDYTHEAFQGAVPDARFTPESLATLLSNVQLSSGVSNASLLYKSEKIPYAFDYSDWDVGVLGTSDHGLHVSGTVGANSGEIRGVAYDTQIAAMKVFSDLGYSDTSAAIAALDDACKLSVDSINMSMGLSAGLLAANQAVSEVYNNLLNAGINVICAVGNDAYQGVNCISGENLPLAANPDYGITGTPAAYAQNMGVASANNEYGYTEYIRVGDEFTEYADSATVESLRFSSLSGTHEYVMIPGVGAAENYIGINVSGKIAVVERGTISFTDKCLNASNAGAIAMIVYDNVDSDILSNMLIENRTIPAASVLRSFGLHMAQQTNKTLEINYGMVQLSGGGLISNFSTWGVTSDLRLKPEITAPGGMIYSTVSNNGYAAYSGTSMASPHVAGAASVVRQSLNERFPNLPTSTLNKIVNSIMMSTATPIVNSNGVYASVRSQGAGLLNLADSVRTGAYLYSEEGAGAKCDLGFSTEGRFEFSFEVRNMTTQPLSFNVTSTVMSDIAVEANGVFYYSLYSEELGGNYATVSFGGDVRNGMVTVQANGSAQISVSLELTQEGMAHIDEFFENGSFVEGFIELESLSAEQCDLSMVFMGFYGDWQGFSVFEPFGYQEESAHMQSTMPMVLNVATGTGFFLSGNSLTEEYYEDRIYYSNVLGGAATLSTIIGLRRSVTSMEYTIRDENGVVLQNWIEDGASKSFYYGNGEFVTTTYSPTGWNVHDSNGRPYPDGTTFTMQITATPENGGQPQSVYYSFTVDSVAPEVNDYTIEKNENGETILSVNVKDNNYLQYAEILSSSLDWTIGDEMSLASERQEDFLLQADITNIAQLLVQNGINASSVVLRVYDYALNYTDKVIQIGPSAFSLDRSVTIGLGGNYDLGFKVYPSSYDTSLLEWRSSDESVVRVENGILIPVSFGRSVVSVQSLSGLYAQCEVTVSGYADTAVRLNHSSMSLTIGGEATLTAVVYPTEATNKRVTWHSSDESIVVVNDGVVTSIGVGRAVITATTACGNIAQCNIEVLPIYAQSVTFELETEITIGDMILLSATVLPQTATYRSVNWISQDESVARIIDNDVLCAVGVGEVVITAVSYDGRAQSEIRITVKPIEVAEIALESFVVITVGESFMLNPLVLPDNATFKDLSFEIQDSMYATINQEGLISGVAVGKTVVTVTAQNGVKRNVEVFVNPIEVSEIKLSNSTISINVGDKATLGASILPENATNPVLYWRVENDSVASVSEGVVTAVGEGSTIVTAYYRNSYNETVSAACNVIVNKIAVTDLVLSGKTQLSVGTFVSLQATVIPSFASLGNITWSSSDDAVAAVDQNGVVTALSGGTAVISATADGVTKTITVTVTAGSTTLLTWLFAGLFALTAIGFVAYVLIQRKNVKAKSKQEE